MLQISLPPCYGDYPYIGYHHRNFKVGLHIISYLL